MARIFLLLAAASFGIAIRSAVPDLTSAVTADADQSGESPLQVDPAEFDAGAYLPGSAFTADFTLTNSGDAELEIIELHAECGCTVPKVDQRRLLPGQQCTLAVRVRTQDVGELHKRLSLKCIETGRSAIYNHTVAVRAEVQPAFVADPPMISVPAGRSGDLASEDARVFEQYVRLEAAEALERGATFDPNAIVAIARHPWTTVERDSGDLMALIVRVDVSAVPETASSTEILVSPDRFSGRSVSIPVLISRGGPRQ